MANSVWIGWLGTAQVTTTGDDIVFPGSALFLDGIMLGATDVRLSRSGANAMGLGGATGVVLDWSINGYLQVRNRAGNAPAAISGSVIVANSGIYAASFTFGAAGNLTTLTSPANGQMNATNNAGTAGVGVDVNTDGVLKVRTRAQTGYATVDALAYQASGTPGVSFSGAITNITVVNGIVTAAS